MYGARLTFRIRSDSVINVELTLGWRFCIQVLMRPGLCFDQKHVCAAVDTDFQTQNQSELVLEAKSVVLNAHSSGSS